MSKDVYGCPVCHAVWGPGPWWSGLSCGCGAWVPFWINVPTQDCDPNNPVDRAAFQAAWERQIKKYLDYE